MKIALQIAMWAAIGAVLVWAVIKSRKVEFWLAEGMTDKELIDQINYDAADGRIITAYSAEYDKWRARINAS